jgi:hypothetical protein
MGPCCAALSQEGERVIGNAALLPPLGGVPLEAGAGRSRLGPRAPCVAPGSAAFFITFFIIQGIPIGQQVRASKPESPICNLCVFMQRKEKREKRKEKREKRRNVS